MSSYQRRQKNISKLSEQDLEYSCKYEDSWHYKYKNNNEIYIGGIANELNEGDIIIVFSQFGEVIDINMPWNNDEDEHKGFCFLKYKDPRSCVLAIDNFNGIELNGRRLTVDHSESQEQKNIDQTIGKFISQKPHN
ncbi:U2 snRNP component IST3, putative [Entamoeba dispar SAW760]|uniref:U2 snRNP component IST3, putative n=1 Tax=Entamoeba dispar (strain ATCC PRA-260 / SAW760) TaxID=370354 RepID=B0EU55_ENTDS|nr:U2 snRNP component IST3, putative [Entamoeba dispar SAW760]EDR21934.1 U2 snRNP component IST3, putative [Entamoeba dispar SAW760]|eukprot:EDR21934.1 U2 snRNP component IST3, putative [Entamoeba dispar SAW760]